MLRADPEARLPVRSARETWFDHGVIALALILLLSGFSTIVEGRDWWITTILVAILTGLTCAVLRGINARFVAVIAIVVELLAITWIFVPETLLAVIPTPETVTGLGDLVAAAREIIVGEQAPVGAAKPIVLVVASSFGLIVIVADLLLQRRRAAPLIGMLLLAVFATPALISGENPSVWLFVSVAALWLVLLRSRTATPGLSRRRGAGPAMILGGAALAAAVVFPVVTPDVSAVATSWGKPPPTVFGRGINPMLELGQNLRRNSTITSLNYTTTFDEAQYLKVATLRDFDGKTWRPGRFAGANLTEEGEDAIDEDIERVVGRTTITIQQLRSSMLPVPYPPTGRVTGLDGRSFFRPLGLTLEIDAEDARGQTYTVPSIEVEPTAEQMRARSTPVDLALGQYVELPEDMPAVIAETAEVVTADADTQYDRVRALQSYLRDGDFVYSETSPVAEDYDGNGVDVIAKFLEVKSGYCVHFSSAMAVMARTLGIPARIAVGYAPGSATTIDDGETRYENTSDDLHAWTEIYFQGVGWVRFDPTTSIGSATSFAEPVADTPDADATETPAQQPAQQRGADRLDDGAVAAADDSSTAPRSALVTTGVLLVVGAVPWLVRAARRRWRLRHGRVQVEPLWRELEDEARDLRIPASAADTPRGFAGRLARRPGVDTVALESLLRRVEQARFSRGAQPEGDGVADLRAVVTSIRTGAPRRRRVRATLLPQSLTGRAPVVRLAESTTLAT